MKNFVPGALALLFCLVCETGFSQNPGVTKPKQFTDYPDVIDCPVTELDRIFTSTPGDNISLTFSRSFSFSGPVVSNAARYSNLQTANIKSPFFNNSLFNISRRIDAANNVVYVGRIINRDFFDGYELKRNESGNYQLVKIETDKVIQSCNQQ
jgi:hypothetical protein